MSNIPSSLAYIQIEGAQFRRPVSEALVQQVGGSINGLLDDKTAQESRFTTDEALIAANAASAAAALAAITAVRDFYTPVGTVIASMLSEAIFQSQVGSSGILGTNWVLADGRNVAGSSYQTLTGNATLPDMRDKYLRGKNNGLIPPLNPAGDLSLGTYQADAIASHIHQFNSFTLINTDPSNTGDIVKDDGSEFLRSQTGSSSITFNTITNPPTTADTEVRPRTIIINYFIRIN